MNTSARLERLRPMMAKEGFDVVVALSPENTLYMAETYIMTQATIRDRLALAVLPLDKDPALIACSIETATIENETWIADKRYYIEFQQSPVKFLADVLKEKGYEKAKVGIELSYLTANYYKELMGELPHAEFVECTRLFDKIRMIKEPKEIEILAKAAQDAHAALDYAIAHTHPGDTEAMFAARIKIHMLERGAEQISFFTIGTGKDSIQVHKSPDNTILADGQIMRLDYGGFYGGYYSDFARTVMIGREDPVHVDRYARYAECYRRTVEIMKPGVRASEVFGTCKRLMEEQGLAFKIPHVGHSLGLLLHEFPMLSPVEDFALEENMICNVEPVSVNDGIMYHCEDLIQITRDGHKVLSEPDFKPHLLRIV